MENDTAPTWREYAREPDIAPAWQLRVWRRAFELLAQETKERGAAAHPHHFQAAFARAYEEVHSK